MSNKLYSMITDQIIQRLDEGTVPWRKPWANSVARNWFTERPYRGINQVLLRGGEYATFNQIKKSGGTVKKGEKGHLVVFWRMIKVKDEDAEEKSAKKEVPMLRYYKVFKIGEQTENLALKQEEISYKHDKESEESAEKIINDFMDKPTIGHQEGGAYYKPYFDYVSVPPKKDFPNLHEYYSTLFHELTHSTGHKSRLNRKGVMTVNKFGSQEYSREELVAELGASMLCGVAGIENDTIDNSAAYIDGWRRKLSEDKKLIVWAAQKAQKASDYILGCYQE